MNRQFSRRRLLAMLAASGVLAACGGRPPAPAQTAVSQEVAQPTATSTPMSAPTATSLPATAAATPLPRVGTVKGNLAADIEMVRLDNGEKVKLSDYRGKAVYLNFWATWCGPCKEEMPGIELVYQKYKDQNIAILGLDVGESREVVEQYLKEQSRTYTFTLLLDEQKKAATRYNLLGYPTSIFIRPDGLIVDYISGATSYQMMDRSIKKALEL